MNYLRNFWNSIGDNWKSGLSIAVVSVPLSISFAIASGGTPIMGLITSAWAGIVAGVLGGSNFNVISPAGAFAGILTVAALQFGVESIPVITVLAGLLIFIARLVNAQKFLRFVPGGAIFGFTIGISAIIAGTQINGAFGLSDLAVHESVLMNILESLRNIGSLDITTTLIFLIFLGILFLLQRFFKKIPSIILATPFGLLLGWLASKSYIGLDFLILSDKYADVSSSILDIPTFSFDWGFLIPAATIAVVGILETMLSAKIADSMTKTRHNERREMLGLSLANIVSGLVGGMPATGVLGPTVLNIKTGASSRVSAILKAVFVALITVVFFGLFQFIPIPVISAILFYVAITMIQRKKFLLYYNHDKYALVIAVLVAVITLYRDPALGILIGSFIGLLLFAEKVSRGSYHAIQNSTQSEKKIYLADEKQFSSHGDFDILVYSVRGVLSHLSAEAHVNRLMETGKGVTNVIIRLREVVFMDIEGVEALDTIINMLQEKSIKVFISGVDDKNEKMLEVHSENFVLLKKEGCIHKKTRYALSSLNVPMREGDE